MASGAGSAQNDVVSRSDPEEQQQHEAESGGGSTAVRIIAAPSAPFCLRLRRLRAAAADDDEHRHHSSHTESWLRAMTLGAMDGIGSVASLILGVAGGSASRHVMLLAGVSAAGEYQHQAADFFAPCRASLVGSFPPSAPAPARTDAIVQLLERCPWQSRST